MDQVAVVYVPERFKRASDGSKPINRRRSNNELLANGRLK